MGVTAVTAEECREIALREASLLRDSDPATAAATALRRAASCMAPVAPRALLDAVETAQQAFPFELRLSRDSLESLLDQMVSYGDLLEAADSGRRLLFLAAPAFVDGGDGLVYLVGARPDDEPLVGHEDSEIQPLLHVRRLALTALDKPELERRGLAELSWLQYLRAPKPVSAAVHMAAIRDLMDKRPPPGHVEGLQALDSSEPARYYRGRWKPAGHLTGEFVARRPQAYGAPLWAFVRLNDGACTALLDLPISREGRGSDEAWRIQSAIDCLLDKPQEIRVRQVSSTRSAADVFAPLPRWLQRRWDLAGAPTQPQQGSLMSYEFRRDRVEEELEFAQATMWLRASRVG